MMIRMVGGWVTGQLADTPARGLPTRTLVNSRTGQLAVSQMLPKRKTKHAKSPMASASCPVCELSSPRVDQSASWQSVSCPVTGGWMFLLVPAHRGSPGQRAVKRSLLFLCTKQIAKNRFRQLQTTVHWRLPRHNVCYCSQHWHYITAHS